MPELFRKQKKKEIQRNLLILRDEAHNLGASKAATIDPKKIVVDDRVRYKCIWSCPHYNKSLMCPPYTPAPDDTRRMLEQYRCALLVRKEGDPQDFAGASAIEKRQWNKYGEELQKIMLKLETSAFYRGFYLAIAFAGGHCRICNQDGTCKGLEQGRCLFPYESRPSMEAMGIDVLTTLDNMGWEAEVVGRKSDPQELTKVGFVGLLLVC